jgi:hypothetical protein
MISISRRRDIGRSALGESGSIEAGRKGLNSCFPLIDLWIEFLYQVTKKFPRGHFWRCNSFVSNSAAFRPCEIDPGLDQPALVRTRSPVMGGGFHIVVILVFMGLIVDSLRR